MRILASLILSFLIFSISNAQEAINISKNTVTDSISKKEQRKIRRINFRHTQDQFIINLSNVQANLKTDISFALPNDILSANISLEDNLGLPSRKIFSSSSFIYRITPRSGLYLEYYRINRDSERETSRDYIFGWDTIPQGTKTTAYLNTQVISAGYLLSVMETPNVYLSAYFNLYFMQLKTGVNSDIGNIHGKVSFTAPLPNFGVIADFRFKPWLSFNTKIGFFSLNTEEFKTSIFSFNAAFCFKPLDWLGITVSYQEFDIELYFPANQINTTINYNYRGPGLGVLFTF